MRALFSQALLADMSATVESAISRNGIVNVSLLSQQIRVRNERDNVALEDIAAELMRLAQVRGAVMEFDTHTSAGEQSAAVH